MGLISKSPILVTGADGFIGSHVVEELLARGVIAIGVPPTIERDEERLRPAKSEVERLLSDNPKAASRLGWRPRYHGIEGLRRGLRETLAWFREGANLESDKSTAHNR